MKPIPVKATSKVFGTLKKDFNQHLNTLAFMKYYNDHVPLFKKMWKEQGKEYWLQFMISLHHSFKTKDPPPCKDPEVKLFTERKTVYALQNISDNLMGHSFPAVNKMMEIIYKVYKDFFKVLLPSISKVEMPKEDENLYSAFDYLFGPETEFPSVASFAEICTLYTFTADSLVRVCQEYESNKYQSAEAPPQKDYWELPLKWHRSNYKPTIFEMKLIASHDSLIKKFIEQEGKEVKWITENLDEIKSTCKHNEELSLLPKEVEISKEGIKDLYSWFFFNSPVMLPELTDEYSNVCSHIFVHPFNQFYLTYYHSVFNARFFAAATSEFRSLYSILEKKKKVDLNDEKLNDKMLELCKFTSLIEKISQYTYNQLSEEDFYLFFDREMEIPANNKDESESDVSCSSLLEVKNHDEWKSWNPSRNAYIESHQATLDRMPWDVPFLMSWQENIYAALLKIDIAAASLRIYPVVESYKQTVINFNRLLKDNIFLILSSMILADHIYYLEGENKYDWTKTIDYRKTLHEIGYRLRSVTDIVDSQGFGIVKSLTKIAWSTDKSETRLKWEPGFWENQMDVERFFICSRRHFIHWDWQPKSCEVPRGELFKEAYEKITRVKFSKENRGSNRYYEAITDFNRYELEEIEKVLMKSFRPTLKLDTSQVCDIFSKAHYITKQEASRFQKKLVASKVPSEAVTYINSLGFIFKKCDLLHKNMYKLSEELDLNRPKFIELLLGHRQFICGFKVNYAMQELINDDPKFCPKPTNNKLEKALELIEDKLISTYEQKVIENIVEKHRKRIWVDNPIPNVPKNCVPELKKEHSFKTTFWKTQSVYNNYSLMEKHRTELLRLVVDKYFSISPGTKGVSLFPYWKTLVCFLPAELFVVHELYEATWETKDAISKIFQLVNYRLIWLREKVMDWLKNSDVNSKKNNTEENNNINLKLGEQYVRMRLAGNTLRDLYVSRFTINEECQPITKGMLNFNILIEVLLNKVFNLTEASDLGVTIFKNCFLQSAEELVEYMEILLDHACLCWNYKTLQFHEDFRPLSFENCETTIYIAKQLIYLCLTRIANKEDLDGELELCLLKVHSMESEIIDQKAIRGPSSPENDDYDLWMACMDAWRSFCNMYEKAEKREIPVPEKFANGSKSWKRILVHFINDDLVKVSKFLKIDQITGAWGFQNFGNCESCPGCEDDLVWELKNLGIVKTKKKTEEKKSEDKKEEKKGTDDKKEDKKGSEDKKEEKKVTEGKKEDKKVTEGKKEEKKVTEGKKEDKKVTEGKKDDKKVTEGKKEDKKGSEDNKKPASAKRSNINKKRDSSEEFHPEDLLIKEALKRAFGNTDAYKVNGKSKSKEKAELYVSRLKVDTSGFKLGEFNLEKSSNTFKKQVIGEFEKFKAVERKKEEQMKKEEEMKKKEKEENDKKRSEGTSVNIAAEGLRKMFGTLAKPKNGELEKTAVNGTCDKIKKSEFGGKKVEIDEYKERTKICAACQQRAPEGVKFKKCSKCKEELLPNPKFYCGRECQLKDWAESHRDEHMKLAQGK